MPELMQDAGFDALIEEIRRARFLDLGSYKSSCLQRRAMQRLRELGITTFTEYREYLLGHEPEYDELLNAILINVTYFFRDAPVWMCLQESVIPGIIHKRPAGRPIRAWSAGCATGEEAYTLAMILSELMGEDEFCRRVKIYATDIDGPALETARRASYTARDVESIPSHLLDRHFSRFQDSYVLHRHLRRAVVFGRHDLTQGAPISRLDLLVCRNTLMYFTTPSQQRILSRFHSALNPDGVIVLGKAEMPLADSDRFVPVELSHRIFRKVNRAELWSSPAPADSLLPAAPASSEAHELEACFRITAESAPGLTWMAGPDRLCTYFNTQWLKFTGRQLEQELGKGWTESVHPDDLEQCLSAQADSFDAHREFTLEYRLRRHDGQYRWVIDRGIPRFTPEGKFAGYIGSCVDITEHRQAETALRGSEARMRAIFETAVDTIITIDQNGIVDSLNPAAERLFGYSRDEVIGQNISMLMPSPDQERHDGYLAHYLQTGERRVIGIGREVTGRRKDGTTFPMELAVSEMIINGQRMFTGIVRDISERKQAEQTICDQRQEMEDFLCIVAHDLKRPLVSLHGLLSILRQDHGSSIEKEGHGLLDLLFSECARMKDIITHLADTSRMGRERVELQCVELHSMISATIERFGPMLERQKVEVSLDCPRVSAAFARSQVQEALDNLVDNALKYGCIEGDGRIFIRCAIHDRHAEISVRDHGPGIPRESHKRVFELFRRGDGAATVKGSGVGLTAVQRLMRRINGKVTLESAPGEGACFTLNFPAEFLDEPENEL